VQYFDKQDSRIEYEITVIVCTTKITAEEVEKFTSPTRVAISFHVTKFHLSCGNTSSFELSPMCTANNQSVCL
jgi:hypothetical protein